MNLVRWMGVLWLVLLFPMHVFGLTYRINQSAGEFYHVPTPSGSASLVFPEPKGEEAYVVIVHADPYFPDIDQSQGLASYVVPVPNPANASSSDPTYQLKLQGHSFRFLLSSPSGVHDWQNPMSVNPLVLETQQKTISSGSERILFDRSKQKALARLLNAGIGPLAAAHVSVAVPPILIPVPVPVAPQAASKPPAQPAQEVAPALIEPGPQESPPVELSPQGGSINGQEPSEAAMQAPAQEFMLPAMQDGDMRTFYVDVTGLNLDPKWQDGVIQSGGRSALKRPARRISQGSYIDLYLDAEAQGFLDDALDALVRAANETIVPRDMQVIGAPTDVDGNGKVIVFLTPVLDGTQASGFTIMTDLFPNMVDLDAPEESLNPFSNEGEVFYAFVPEDVDQNGLLLATMAHELAHLIYFGNRIVEPSARRELASAPVTWFTEALAYLAEDLSGYGSEPSGPKQLALFALTAFPNLSLTGKDVFVSYDLGDEGGGDSSYRRGLGYLFLRFLFDRAGGASISRNGALNDNGGIAWLYRVFSYSGLNKEMRAIERASNRPFADLMKDWYATLVLEGVQRFKGGTYRYKEPVKDPLSGQEVGIRIYGPNDTGNEGFGGFGRVYFTGPYIKRLESIPARTPALDWDNSIAWVPFGSVLPLRLPAVANVIPTAGASFFELVSTNGPKERNVVFSTETPYPLSVTVVRVQ